MMKVLVTGADGFVAHYLIPHLKSKGAEVFGTALDPSKAKDLGIPISPLNITKPQETSSLIRHMEPTHIVHLAAVSSVQKSFKDPVETEDVNLKGTGNVLSAAADLDKPPLTLLIGSSDEYGVNDGNPLKETPVSQLNPVSPYAKSKKAVEELVESNAKYKTFTIRTRSFPHIGPGQAPQFFVPEVALQIVKIERGEQTPVIRVGNISAVRDFSDVRDVVRAYQLLLEKGTVGEVYNVCSGKGMTMRMLLDKMIAFAKIPIRFEHAPEKMRPADIPQQVGDNSKIKGKTGWQSQISIDQTLKDVIEYTRGRPS